jgi:hypothetical protein
MKFKTHEYISSLHGDNLNRKLMLNHLRSKQCGFALDSNVFRDKNFVNFLAIQKEKIQFFLPTIVQMEVGYFYRSKGKSWEEFLLDIQDFDCILLSRTIFQAPDLIDLTYQYKQYLPLREHFRDYMIGLECNLVDIALITENVSHFQVFKKDLQTPKQFVKNFPINNSS